MKSEPALNLSETFVLQLAVGLLAIWAIGLVLPAGLAYEVDRLSVLAPLDRTRGSGFVALLAYSLRHVDVWHLAINLAGLIWFGTLTMRGARAQAVRTKALLVPPFVVVGAFFVGAVVGGLFQWAWWALAGIDMQVLVGASAGVSALMAVGAFAVAGRVNMLRVAVVWTLVNLVLALFPFLTGGNLGWPSHVGGYLAGIVLARALVTPNSTPARIT